MRILVTGGAGFVGGNLCVELAERHSPWEIVALDNLHRAGSELNLPRLDSAGVRFVRGDVREAAEIAAAGPCDALVECSAEPSALAGYADTAYPFQTNLVGAYNCLEHARAHGAQFLFLSTSRVYPLRALRALRLREGPSRLELEEEQPVAGASTEGVSEAFPLEGARTLYGTTKLAAELLVAEYAEAFGLSTVIDRCGVIAGPWQMGKVDQGVFAWWLLSHRFGHPLSYIGYGGSGKQVRDLLHVADLVSLVEEQLTEPERWSGVTANVGGGNRGSLSLLEATEICRELTGTEVPIGSEPNERPGDVPLYVSDCARLFGLTGWRPARGPRETLADIDAWVRENEDMVRGTLGFGG